MRAAGHDLARRVQGGTVTQATFRATATSVVFETARRRLATPNKVASTGTDGRSLRQGHLGLGDGGHAGADASDPDGEPLEELGRQVQRCEPQTQPPWPVGGVIQVAAGHR